VKGYFLSVDILGFSEIVLNLEREELTVRVEEWISLVKELCRSHQIHRYQLISDTLFVGCESDDHDLVKLVAFSKDLLNSAMALSIPLRGAIAIGEYEWSPELVYGPVVIEAYRYESKQNWVGISCVPGFDIPNDMWGELVCYPIPCKSGDYTMSAAVNWDVPSFENLVKLLSEKGLWKAKNPLSHEWMTRVEKTINYSMYKSIATKKGESLSRFAGFGPLHILEREIDL